MVHEDDDDKIRRNLVVMSAAILLTAFLEVPVQALLSKSVSSGWVPSLAKGWAAALVLLFYFALRYRFHKVGATANEVLAQAYKIRLEDSFVTALQKQKMRGSRGWKDIEQRGRAFVAIGNAAGQNIELSRQSEAADPAGPNVEPTVTSGISYIHAIGWKSVRAQVNWSSSDPNRPPAFGQAIDVPTNIWVATSTRLRAMFSSWIYSAEGIRFAAPMLFAALASGVAAFKWVSEALAT